MKLITGYLGNDLNLEGSLKSSESLRIDCTYIGDIKSDNMIIVGAFGKIMGDIQAPVIRVDGLVDGNLRASELVELMKNAKINGNIFTPVGGLEMRVGSNFEGKFIMNSSR
tara:strand:- start:177 stop:509 length:333 start_codon:yes stop_codon:yes gene_type:complete